MSWDSLHSVSTLRSIRYLGALLLVTTVLLGCKSEQGPVTSKTSKFEVADDEEAASSNERKKTTSSDRPSSQPTTELTELPTLSELDESVASVAEEPITPPNRQTRPSNRTSRPNASRNQEADTAQLEGASSESIEQSDPEQNTGESAAAPPVASQESLESLTPPEGPPEVLWQFIVQLKNRQPRGRTEREILQDIQRIMAAKIQAAEAILANGEAPADLRRQSVDAKLEALQTLIDIGVPNARQHLLAFAQALRRDPDPKVATMGRILAYTLMVNQVVEGQVGDAQPIVLAGEQLIGEEPDRAPTEREQLETYTLVLTQVCSAAMTIMEAGYIEDGKQLVDIIKAKYTGSGDENVDVVLAHLVDEAHYMELEINKKMQDFVEGKKQAFEPLMVATRDYLGRANPSLRRLQRALYIGGTLERMQEMDAAKEVYQTIGEIFRDEPDPAMADMVKETVAYADRRMALIEQPLSIEGTLSNGSPLDWSSYQGKVVLVTFWSTDNFMYLQQEIPSLKALLNTYRDRGFEILSVNVDEDKQRVEKFLQFQPLPWPTVLDGGDGQNKMMEKCGVSTVPFTLLIDQSGKVIQLHPNSLTLQKQLVTLLGKPDTAPPDGKDEAEEEQTGRNERRLLPLRVRPAAAAASLTSFVSESGENESNTAAAEQEVKEEAAGNKAEEPKADDNPYLAPSDLGREALAEFLLKMEEKPKSIQERPGFDEAIIDAADRILKADEQDSAQLVALDSKLRTLHKWAVGEKDGAEDQLWQFVQSWQTNPPQRIARDIEMLTLEHELLLVDELPIEQVPALLDRAHEFYSNEKLTERHARMASATVHAINRLNVEEREPHFQRFGLLFSQSSERLLASYGRRIAEMKSAPNEELIGTQLELSGVTALGVELNWDAYRGKVVMVDFWATWCGPCRSEMPHVKKILEKYRERGFDVVGVNLDENVEQLGAYLDQEDLPWNNIIGDGARDAAERYDVVGIPTMALVDRDGKVVAVSHSSAELIAKIEALLQ